MITDTRKKILIDYAKWHAFSAFRQGPSNFRGRTQVYGALDLLDLSELLDESKGEISKDRFECWHDKSIKKIQKTYPCISNQYGWIAKLINIFLKTYVYVGREGRHGLVEHIHPPIDSGLWRGVKKKYRERKDIILKTHCVGAIADISSKEIYKAIIEGLTLVSKASGCLLIEVEQYWDI